MPPGELADGADVGAATAAEDEGPVGQEAHLRLDLRVERLLVDDGCLRPREIHERGLLHLDPAVSPRSRDAHQAGVELPPAAVALVVAAERDRGVGAARRAARTKRAHRRRSQVSERVAARIPTRSYSRV